MTKKVMTELDVEKLANKNGLILFFYPKAHTSGCSLEVGEYNKRLKDFQDLGYNVVGISVDDEKTNEGFSQEYGLNFSLISDLDKKYVQEFGVWGNKAGAFGVEQQGVVRSTFVLDPKGNLILEMRDVNPTTHIQELYTKLKK